MPASWFSLAATPKPISRAFTCSALTLALVRFSRVPSTAVSPIPHS